MHGFVVGWGLVGRMGRRGWIEEDGSGTDNAGLGNLVNWYG